MTIPRTALAVIVAATILPLGMACGNSSSGTKTVKRDANAFKWGVIFAPSERTIKIGGGVPYCEGAPRPRFRSPDIEYQGRNMYIRLILKAQRPRVPKKGPCLGSELLITRTITLRQDLSDLNLYDSGIEPPELRWPRP